ncbi:sigma 54-interacting transcriptional regulator [bacterium]|nr:sigma 54-interacting transcriptional regulator [bacterium]
MDQRQLELQCELYKLLLNADKSHDPEIETLLSEALRLVVALTGARLGYIELKGAGNEVRHSTFECTDEDLKTIKHHISSGIIADTIASGETVVTPAAFLDDRFQQYQSVHAGSIGAVLCSPIINDQVRGVIYLQGNDFFGEDLKNKAGETELFTRHIAPLLRHLKKPAKTTIKTLRSQYNLTGVIGQSDKLIAALKEVLMVADLDTTVLLKGETGTGKSLMARIIHNNSSRRYGPFFHLNCANLPEELLESELFGAKKGAHSAAHSDINGKISAAENGTLFLDEIGELSVPLQAKLLQFLEEGFYYPLGSKHPQSPDVRIIAASNIDFEEAVKSRTFRTDLYYRICVFPIHFPALRDCREDIRAFVEFFTGQYCEKYVMDLPKIPEETFQILECYHWPGNVRELHHKTQHAVLRAKRDASSTLKKEYFFSEEERDQIFSDEVESQQHKTYREGKSAWEKAFITKSLLENDWNISQTAKLLEMSRSQLNKLIRDHQIKREKGD